MKLGTQAKFFVFWILVMSFVFGNILIKPRKFATPEDKVWIDNEFDVIRNQTNDCGFWGNNIVIAKQGIAVAAWLSDCRNAATFIRNKLIQNGWQLPSYNKKHRVFYCKSKYIAEVESVSEFKANLTISLKYYKDDQDCLDN